MTEPQAAPSEQAPELEFQIQIDRIHYEVHRERVTGEQIRRVPPTPIGPDRDLYEVRPGEQDLLIGDADVVRIRDGLRFFTAPHHINPGAEAEPR